MFLVNVRLFVFNKPVEQAGELAGHGGNGPWERQEACARGRIVLPRRFGFVTETVALRQTWWQRDYPLRRFRVLSRLRFVRWGTIPTN